MKFHFFPILRHAATMVGRTMKSYALLSVTIVLSFSLLLGYLVYTDSALYNAYKESFALDRSVLIASRADMAASPVNALWEQAENIGKTHMQLAYVASARFNAIYFAEMEQREILSHSLVYCIQEHVWAFYTASGLAPEAVVWLDGVQRQGITLGTEEALISEGAYYALGLDQQETPYYTIILDSPYGKPDYTVTVRIVGLLQDGYLLRAEDVGQGVVYGWSNNDFNLVVSAGTLNPFVAENARWNQYTVFYTDSPEQVDQLCKNLNFYTRTAYETQNAALEAKREATGTKAIITATLLLLLGINLYSSFTNALEDRKFEIGVKRAVGASAGSIVRQFLYESWLVMTANILISVAVVVDVFLVVKPVMEKIPDAYGRHQIWSICLSPYSAAMFAVCAAALTVVFSLIFAYKSTRVEIVAYLKAE